MLSQTIPFEIHITLENLPSQRENEFIDFCKTNRAKPLIIELAQGECIQQPMLGKIIKSDNFDKVLTHTNELSQSLTDANFKHKRLKLEIPAYNYKLLQNLDTAFEKYFEWHGKINLSNKKALLNLCEKHKAHLSHNSLKNEGGLRFITLREFGAIDLFNNRIENLSTDLAIGNWEIHKQESEYCIYDNNTFLDNGWLPQ